MKILSSLPLLKLLQGYGISRIDVAAPKQTPTTQRWKIQLHTENTEMPYHTKIEFSRRSETLDTRLANVSMRICQSYRLPPMRLSHYDLQNAVTQKILALANRSLTQARDIFDLYHLLHVDTPALSMKRDLLIKAEEALLSISFNDYKSQVVNFLEAKEQHVYADQQYWSTIAKEVFRYLQGLQR